jgi:hypothetical protein
MLALILFNLGGYILLFHYFIDRSDASIIQKINYNRYKETDLVQVKIPVHLNIQDWSEYEVISGQVKLKDTCYDYAELKMTRDTLFLMCIRNYDKASLINANRIYARQVSDIPSSKKAHFPPVKKIISDSQYNYCTLLYPAFAPKQKTRAWRDYTFAGTVKASIKIPGQPPEMACIFS